MAPGGSGGVAIARLAAAPPLTNPSLPPSFRVDPAFPLCGVDAHLEVASARVVDHGRKQPEAIGITLAKRKAPMRGFSCDSGKGGG